MKELFWCSLDRSILYWRILEVNSSFIHEFAASRTYLVHHVDAEALKCSLSYERSLFHSENCPDKIHGQVRNT